MYRSVWWDQTSGQYFINTRNRDDSVRDIDEMNTAWRQFRNHLLASSELHDWGGDAIRGLTCRKCGSWCNTWHVPPERGCTPSRPELSTAMTISVRRSAAKLNTGEVHVLNQPC